MTNAVPGEKLNAEDKAALLLAWHFGYGSGWTRDYTMDAAEQWKPGVEGSEDTPAAVDGLHMGHDSETLELAKVSIHRDPKKQPAWFRALPEEQQADLLAWSNTHPFQRDMPDRVREFKHWKTTPTKVLTPRSPSGADVAIALAIADLPGPLRPVLELAALQQADHYPLVKRCLLACGVDARVADFAMRRWLFPDEEESQAAAAKRIRIRKQTLADWLKANESKIAAATRRLRRWHRRASLALLDAYGHAEVRSIAAAAPATRRSAGKLAMPRFDKGWDRLQPTAGTLAVYTGKDAAVFAAATPAPKPKRRRARNITTARPKPKRGNVARLVRRETDELREPWLSMHLGRVPPWEPEMGNKKA